MLAALNAYSPPAGAPAPSPALLRRAKNTLIALASTPAYCARPSGVVSRADLDAMAARGVKCFLVGEALMRARDIEAATRALLA